MKSLSTFVVLIFLSLCTSGQIFCGAKWPPENLRPDTITCYIFTNISIPVNKVPTTKISSNFSFKTSDFKVTWMPVAQGDINKFITNSIESFDKYEILDTLHADIFGTEHKAIYLRSKRKFFLLIYQDRSGTQDVFLLTNIKKRKAQQALDFLGLNLRQ